jgi:hypothetical protein
MPDEGGVIGIALNLPVHAKTINPIGVPPGPVFRWFYLFYLKRVIGR